MDDALFGVTDEVLYARKTAPVPGAQWTGIITTIAIEMLEQGLVDGVICVQNEEHDRFMPKPVIATTREEIMAARGVKPTLAPSLNVLAAVEASGLRRILFCGVGCQVQALRSVEQHLGLEKLYVIGTNCTDNGPREGLEKFLNAASDDPATVKHYEFMQDYRVHLKHDDGRMEKVPYFCLPADDLNDVIAPSCYSCFDYPNALADLVVGYMGVPYMKVDMTQHPQYITVRNGKGAMMLDLIRPQLEVTPAMESGDRRAFVMQTVEADDNSKLGMKRDPAPRFVGEILANVLEALGPKGLEFGRYSLDYHIIRNYILVNRNFPPEKAAKMVPSFAQKIVDSYDIKGAITRRVAMRPEDLGMEGPAAGGEVPPAAIAAAVAAGLVALGVLASIN
mmetsp:Transcript_32457/g.103342  ORF Transcript_32457/g.103342 Transcript_32457/m.103342 type:complete len:393 (-) Transcript_32457:80-1258(-)